MTSRLSPAFGQQSPGDDGHAPATRPRQAPVQIGVVVVNWNGWQDTLECLESLRLATPAPERVVVVDNGSHDDSVGRVLRWADERRIASDRLDDSRDPPARESATAGWLTVLCTDRNRGFAGGSNLGLALLRADGGITHFLLLNNDATVAGDFFGELRAALAADPRAGLLSGTIYTAGAEREVWYAGGVAKPLRALMLHAHDVPRAATPVATPFVCGCSMLISRELFHELGPLPECYFPGYWEDAEYSTRAARLGFSLRYAPRAAVYHKVGASFGHPAVSHRTAYVQARHRVFYVRRNLRGWARVAALGYLVVTKPARAVAEALKGRPRVGLAIARGTAAGFLSRAAHGA